MSKILPTKKPAVKPKPVATKASTICPPAKKAAVKAVPNKKAAKKGAKEEFRLEESRPGEWAWEMFRGGRFVARGEHYSKKGNAARAAEKFNKLLKVEMTISA